MSTAQKESLCDVTKVTPTSCRSRAFSAEALKNKPGNRLLFLSRNRKPLPLSTELLALRLQRYQKEKLNDA